MKGIYVVDGEVIFHDPGPEMEPILSELDPSFRIQSVRPPEGFVPKFQRLRKRKVNFDRPLFDLSLGEMKKALSATPAQEEEIKRGYIYSRLDVLQGAALSILKSCNLCGWNCQINRFSGGTGKCGLGSAAFPSQPFIHIGEEPVINPAVVTNFAGGCALRCQYCIDYKLLNSADTDKKVRDPRAFWKEVGTLMAGNTPVNTLEFTNPTESLAGVVEILTKAPADLNLPLVFNCHLYGSKEFYDLAGWIADVFLVDLRYGQDNCAKRLSRVDHYMSQAKLGLTLLAEQGARVLLRVLILPCHVDCCVKPAMELLAEYRSTSFVSILTQFVPEFEAYLDPDLRRRPTRTEIEKVKALVEKNGLRDICVDGKGFWGPTR